MRQTLLIGLCVAAAVAIFAVFYYAKREHFDPSVGRHNFITLYSEPNLSCDLGGTKCQMSIGTPGICDVRSRRCVEEPYWFPEKQFHDYSLEPPIGELNPECQWRGICNRSNNEMGVCMSGLCYPSTVDVQ